MVKKTKGKNFTDYVEYEASDIVPDSIFTPAEYEFKQEPLSVAISIPRPSLWTRIKWRVYYWRYRVRHPEHILHLTEHIWWTGNMVCSNRKMQGVIWGNEIELSQKIEKKETELMYHLNTEYYKDGEEEDASGGEDTQSEAEKEYPKQNND